MISTPDRQTAIALINEAITAGARRAKACAALEISDRTLRRKAVRFGLIRLVPRPSQQAQRGRTPDPVAVKIAEVLAGFENDPKFNLGNHGYTLRRAKGKGASGFIAYKNEKPE